MDNGDRVIMLATGNTVYVLREDQRDIVAQHRMVHDVVYPASDGPTVNTIPAAKWPEVREALLALDDPPEIEDLRGGTQPHE